MDLKFEVDYMEDRTFKIMFLHQDVLDYFLGCLFDYLSECKIDIEHVNAQELIPADNIYLRDYYGDIIAYGKNEYVSLEAFSKKKNYDAYKSILYAARLFGNQLDRGEKVKKCKKVISINVIDGKNGRKGQGIRDYGIVEKRDYELFPRSPFTYIEIYLENVISVPYEENEHEFITFLRFMSCKNTSEMKIYARRNKVMENAVSYIEDYYRKTAKVKHESYLNDAREIGKSEGIKIGKSEGIEIGKSKGQADIVKSMKDNNMNEQEIARITKLPLKKVKSLLML